MTKIISHDDSIKSIGEAAVKRVMYQTQIVQNNDQEVLDGTMKLSNVMGKIKIDENYGSFAQKNEEAVHAETSMKALISNMREDDEDYQKDGYKSPNPVANSVLRESLIGSNTERIPRDDEKMNEHRSSVILNSQKPFKESF